MKDLASSLKPVESIAHAQYTGTKTDGTGTTRAGFESFTILVNVSAVGAADASNYFTVGVYDSEDGVTYAATDSTNYITSAGWDRLINATSETGSFTFGWVSDTAAISHIKVVLTETGTVDATLSATIIKGHPMNQPTSA